MRLPPFAKSAAQYSPTTELRVYLGDNPQAWDVVRLRNGYGPAVMLPAGDDYRHYAWPVARREVLIMQVGPYGEMQEFAAHLLELGAQVVRVLHGEALDVFRAA